MAIIPEELSTKVQMAVAIMPRGYRYVTVAYTSLDSYSYIFEYPAICFAMNQHLKLWASLSKLFKTLLESICCQNRK